MSLSEDEVRHVARLARLALTDEQVSTMRTELSSILAYAEQVQQVTASDVAPTSHAYALQNVLRADVPTAPLTTEIALRTAPRAEDGRFAVPAILDEDL